MDQELFETTLASIGDAVIATDANGNISFMNPEAERLTGWKMAEAAGQPLPKVFRIINEASQQPVENPVEKVIKSGVVVGLANHTLLISRSGEEIPIDDSAAPIRKAGGPLHGVVLVFRDVSEQRKAQRARAHLAAIVEHSGDVMLTKNLNGIIQSWNAAAERLFGYRAEEIIGKHVTTLFPRDRLNEEDHILGRLHQGQPVERLETVRVAKDGTPIPVAVSISPLKDSEGHIVGASKVIHDIRELVAARQALLHEKEVLSTTLASIGDGVIVTDGEGRVTFLNQEAQRLTGWENSDAAGRPLPEVFRIINEDSRQAVEDPVEKVLRLGTVVGMANHTILIRKDGVETPIDDSAAPIRLDGGPLHGVVLVFRDFTERKRAEQALRAKDAELEAIINSTPFMLTRCGRDLKYRFVSDAYARLAGRPVSEITGKPIAEVMGEEGFKTILPHIENVLRGQTVQYETLVNFQHQGSRVLDVWYTPEKSPTGEVIGWVASILDVTDRRKAQEDLRAAHAQLADRAVHLEKLVSERTAKLSEMVGELQHVSYAIVHDMRAPLRAMNVFALEILERLAADKLAPELQEDCRRIISAAARLDKLIRDTLNYTKAVLQEVPLQPVDLAVLVPGLIETYPNLQPQSAEITIENHLPVVLGDESLLTQCFSNLLGNAVKFVPKGARPKVRIRTEHVATPHNGPGNRVPQDKAPENNASTNPALHQSNSSFVRISIQDNGIGIPVKAQSRLFGMFQRLTAEYEGTGIGLAIVRKVVERMGGRVGAESEPNKGSRFWVDLRLASPEARGSPVGSSSRTGEVAEDGNRDETSLGMKGGL